MENLIPKPGQNHAMDWVTILLLAIIFTCFALLRWARPFRCGVEGQDDDLTTGKPEVCVICLEDVTSEDPCRQLPCCGVVHTHCLLEKEKLIVRRKESFSFHAPSVSCRLHFAPSWKEHIVILWSLQENLRVNGSRELWNA